MKRFGGEFGMFLDQLVRERTGLASARRHIEARERLLGRAMERAGVHDEAVYLALLRRDPAIFDELIADLTVPETYFFRDPPHYELLRREVLPAIVRAHDARHVIEVWSAGCASGEEPYSLAILLEQERLDGRSSVLGTDISVRALTRAREGAYGRWSLRATQEHDRARYFERAPARPTHGGRDQPSMTYRLIPRIRAKVRFERHSLSATRPPPPRSRGSGFDLILCRNVLIYFDPQAVADTAQRLARCLVEGGWLLTSPTDPPLEIEEWCDAVSTPCGMLYRRRQAGAVHALPTGAARRMRSPQARDVPVLPARVASPTQPRPLPAQSTTEPRSALPSSPSVKAQTLDAQTSLEAVRALERAHGSAQAEAGCRDLLAREPLSAALHTLHGWLLADLGRDAEAEQAARRALYLDRTFLMAQLLSASLRERHGDRQAAQRSYLQLAEASRARAQADGNDALVPLGEGLSHGALFALASQRASALERQRSEEPHE